MTDGFDICLTATEMMAKAREITGIEIVDTQAEEPLQILCRSLCEEAQLHEDGARAFEQKLVHLLATRLRMQRDFTRHPEIAEEPFEAPVFILGMARSGTTKLQKILSASGDFNFLPFWMNHHPALLSGDRNESTATRIRESEEWCRWFDTNSPEAKLGHGFETHEPEEQTVLIEGCLRTLGFFGWANVPGYLQWVAGESPRVVFEFLRDSLRYLQWQGQGIRGRRWLIKSPIFYGQERELLAVFPEAKIVMTHRTPLHTIPSTIRLVETFHRPYDSAPVDAAGLKAGFAYAMNQHLDLRAQGVIAPLDIGFSDVHSDAMAVVEQIYRFAGMELSDTATARMRNWETDNPPHKSGKFNYSLAAYGFDEAVITQDFKRYFAFLDKAGLRSKI